MLACLGVLETSVLETRQRCQLAVSNHPETSVLETRLETSVLETRLETSVLETSTPLPAGSVQIILKHCEQVAVTWSR
jgi:hypothetical protein